MKTVGHYHLWDLPKFVFPRKKGNKSKQYAEELGRLYKSLTYTESKLQHSAQISIFNIKSITRKKGYITNATEVFSSVEDFVYHYENFCYRTFSLREKIVHFLNSLLEIGYEDKEVKIKPILMSPQIRNTKIYSCLVKFNEKTPLAKVIQDRNALTHQLYFHQQFDHYLRPQTSSIKNDKWFSDWSKLIVTHTKRSNDTIRILFDINHIISGEVVKIKESTKTKTVVKKIKIKK